jgi:hypothetical protein
MRRASPLTPLHALDGAHRDSVLMPREGCMCERCSGIAGAASFARVLIEGMVAGRRVPGVYEEKLAEGCRFAFFALRFRIFRAPLSRIEPASA